MMILVVTALPTHMARDAALSRVRPAPPRHGRRARRRRRRRRRRGGRADDDALLPAQRRPVQPAVGVVHDDGPGGASATAAAEQQLEQAPRPAAALRAEPVHLRLQRVALHLEAGHVLAEAAELVVLRGDLALGGAPRAAIGAAAGDDEVGGAAGLEGAEGAGGPLGEAGELAAVLGEEDLDDAAHGEALVLDGVRRRLRRELARVDQPAQRSPLLLPCVRVRLEVGVDGAVQPVVGGAGVRRHGARELLELRRPQPGLQRRLGEVRVHQPRHPAGGRRRRRRRPPYRPRGGSRARGGARAARRAASRPRRARHRRRRGTPGS
ncbi:hypothetical protein EE612_027461 [Oryza sativa]|nr:hypothetical protein EE612_027461 [Oryza sativa]